MKACFRRRPRACRSGFTLVEMLMASLLFALILSALGWMAVDTSRMGSVVSTNATLQSQGRIAIDRFVNDVRSSRQIVTAYTAPDGTVYSSGTGTCVVLAAPSYASDGTIATTTDSAGNTVPAHYDYIVYHLVPTAAGSSSGPCQLNRRVDVYLGSARSSAPEAVIASNIQSASFTCLVDQPITGNGVDAQFFLNTLIDVSGLGQGVTVNGVPLVLGTTTAQYAPPGSTGQTTDIGTLNFAAAPANNAVIDAIYPVDPTHPASPANINEVSLALTLAVTSASLGSSAPQTTALTGTAALRNH